MTQYETETILRELYHSLDERWRPEDVAQKIVLVLPLVGSDREILEKAAQVGRDNLWSSMSKDFERPGNMSRQLKVAEELFGKPVNISAQTGKRSCSSGRCSACSRATTSALTADAAIGPTLLTPRSKASPLDDARHGSPILPATELNRTSANRLR
jgi:hypothetical protein